MSERDDSGKRVGVSMLRLLMGRARTGKSGRILKEIAEAGKANPAGRQILLVPEHASHVAEVDVCRACGDTASRHVEVLTFKLLASRVLSLTGGSADVVLDNGGKLLLLQRTLQELAGVLKVYCRPSRRSAFLKSLLDVMEELSAYAVPPETLIDCVQDMEGEGGEKLRDIALIYSVYLAKLHSDGRDARDRLEKLEERLEESGYIDGKDIYLDGYSYFTGRELRILRIILRRAANVTVALLGSDEDRDLFVESLRVRDRLLSEAKGVNVDAVVETMPSGEAKTVLEYVEQGFFRECPAYTGDCGAVRIMESPDAYTEIERAAAEILRMVRERGLRFRDITVTARNLSAYQSMVETVFTHYGIPLYSSGRRDILQQPIASFVLGALDAVTGGFEYEDMFRCLKTGLAGLSPEECDVLENYVITWDIHGSMWVRDTAWAAHPDGYGKEWDVDSLACIQKVNALRRRVCVPFAGLSLGLREDTAREKVLALYHFLEDVRLPELLEKQTKQMFAAGEMQRAEETAQLWTILCDTLDQFADILGEIQIEAEEFVRLFRLILTQYSVGTIPAALDRVNLSEMTRNDRHTVRALLILGANDGVVPAVETGGGILREEDRLALEERDILLSPHGLSVLHLEFQNLYAALAQPTEQLFVSYPVGDAKGGELRASFVVGRLREICPDIRIEKADSGRLYRLTAIGPALEYAGEYPDGKAWRWFEQNESFRPALEAMRHASTDDRGRLSREAVRSLYGKSITLSASRMDKARSCHFAFFMQYGLRVKKRTAAGFDAPQIGTFIHDVMEHTLSAAREAGGIKTISPKALHKMTKDAISAYIDRELPDLEKKNARFRYLFRRLCESAYRMMDEVADELRESDFIPLAFELSFGAGGQMPAISLHEDQSEMRIVGQVDRVDGWMHDGKLFLRVIDYKTGRKSFNLSELRYGLGVQMLLYLFSLERMGGRYFGADQIVPAGVLYTPTRDEILALPRDSDDETIRREMQKALRRSGMVLFDTTVLQAMDHSVLEGSHRLPVSVKTGRDGEKSISGGLATAEQLGKLSICIHKLLCEITDEAGQGNIDADPVVRSPQETACTYCPYVQACHFEPGRGRDRYQYLVKTQPDAFWEYVDRTAEKKGESDG